MDDQTLDYLRSLPSTKLHEALEILHQMQISGLVQRKVPEFREWLRIASPEWEWGFAYQEKIYEELDLLVSGKNRRLMIFMPPRHGKSECVTVRFSVWLLLKNPKLRIVVGAYNSQLAEMFSRTARALAIENGLVLSTEIAKADEWHTAEGGMFKAVGVGSGITGFGADYVIIDDPIKSREEANSAANRQRVHGWWKSDIYTRHQKNVRFILIQTRWHEDDLAGRLLTGANAKKWRVLNLPAIAEQDDPLGRKVGEALCPEWFDVEDLGETKAEIGTYEFSALYQQRPTPEEGARFKQSWFQYFDADDEEFYKLSNNQGGWTSVAKKDCKIFQTCDPAATKDDEGDYFVLTTWAMTPCRDLLLLDMFREHAETTQHEKIMVEQFNKWKPMFIGVENRTYGLTIIQRLLTIGLPVIALDDKGDKFARSITAVARYQNSTVYHLTKLWNLFEVEDELIHFPYGLHDDIVDTVGYACNWISSFPDFVEKEEAIHEAPEDNRKMSSAKERKEFFYGKKEPELETMQWW